MLKTIVMFIVIYFVMLAIISKHFENHAAMRSYSINGDLWSLARDNYLFDRNMSRESTNKFSNDTEKCEWALEKLKDLFQFFSVADNSLWPYQVIISLVASLMILYQLKVKIEYTSLFPLAFFLFVFIDLPRRFLSFHRNAAIGNKALNIYSFYYRNLKGNTITDRNVYFN
jgi:hypothetical protein